MTDNEIIRKAEDALCRTHSECAPFSEHLIKWTDGEIPDMYDNNAFEYSEGATGLELLAALKYQQEKGDHFLKLQGRVPLEKILVDKFRLEEVVTETMILENGLPENWTGNPKLSFAHSKEEDIAADVLEIEKVDFEEDYGADFCERCIGRHMKSERENEALHYFTAYLDGRVVAACFAFEYEGTVGIDGLHTHKEYRNRYIATSLMAEVARKIPGLLYLHAYADDTPKEMYEKMGFVARDYLYEYLLKWE